VAGRPDIHEYRREETGQPVRFGAPDLRVVLVVPGVAGSLRLEIGSVAISLLLAAGDNRRLATKLLIPVGLSAGFSTALRMLQHGFGEEPAWGDAHACGGALGPAMRCGIGKMQTRGSNA
jgi:hypothetical protein